MLIFIHGEDTFRSREKLRELIAEFRKKRDPQGLNIARLQGSDLTIERFRHEMLSQGFLASKRMVVVDGLLMRGRGEVADQVAEFLSSSAVCASQEGNIAVFWEEGDMTKEKHVTTKWESPRGKTPRRTSGKAAGALRDLLQAQEYVFSFPLLGERELTAWVRNRVKRMGSAIEPHAEERLVEITGNNLWRLDRELGKLTVVRRGEVIGIADIEEVGEIEAEPKGFAFTDAVVMRRVPQSLQEFEHLAETGVEPLLIHGMLVRIFRTLALVKSYQEDHGGMDALAASRNLGLHPFVVGKTAPYTNRFSWQEIKEIYRRLLVLDLNLKRQGEDSYLPLELFVMNLDC